jgi:hypothetical protein
MSDGDPASGLDVIDPMLLASFKSRPATPKLDALTDAEKVTLAASNAACGVSARQMRGKLRRQLLRQIDAHRLQGGPRRPPVPAYFGPPVRIGFDAEWVTLPDGGQGWRNELLCLTAVVDCGGNRSRLLFKPRGPSRDDRPTMAEFVHKVLLKALREGVVPSMPDKVVMYAHFLRGDLASFRNFWAVKRQFRGLGRTLASRSAGHMLDLDSVQGGGTPSVADDDDAHRGWSRTIPMPQRGPDGRKFTVRVRFVDTIKLTPGQKGLAYLGGDLHP